MKLCQNWLNSYKRWRSRRKGAVIVELAVTLPIFMLLIVGTIETGRAVMVKNMLEEAARAGCRIATLEASQEQDVYDIVDQAMDRARLDGYTVTIDPLPQGSAAFLEPVTVSVSIPYASVALLSSSNYLADAVLTGTCVMPSGINDDDGDGDDPDSPPPGDDDDDDDDD